MAPTQWAILAYSFGSNQRSHPALLARLFGARTLVPTFDVMFDDDETYAKVKNCGTLTQATVALLYHSDEGDVIASLFWDSARAFKATIK
jgi:hypothetical protein